MAEPTYEELKAKLAELEKQGGARRSGALEFRVGEKGGVSVYGLGRFPVTLYYEQWIRLLEAAPQLRKFLEDNKAEGKLKLKEKESGVIPVCYREDWKAPSACGEAPGAGGSEEESW